VYDKGNIVGVHVQKVEFCVEPLSFINVNLYKRLWHHL